MPDRARLFLITLALGASVSNVSAQTAPVQARPVTHVELWKGLAAGFSFGAGTLSFDPGTRKGLPSARQGGGAGGVWGTWRFLPQWAISGDVNVVGPLDQGTTPSLVIIAAQYWATPRFWLKGGAGWSSIDTFDAKLNRETVGGSAFSVAVGADLLQAGNIIVDAQLRFARSRFGDASARTVSAQFGFAWRLTGSTMTPVVPAEPAQIVEGPEEKNVAAIGVGLGGLLGVAYERNLASRLGIGIGLGSSWDIVDEQASGLIPVYVSTTPIGRKHRLYAGGGVAFVHVPASVRDYAVGWEPRIGWSTYPNVSVGYEYRGVETVWRVTYGVWHQPSGIPGGALNVRESGFFTAPGFLIAKRF